MKLFIGGFVNCYRTLRLHGHYMKGECIPNSLVGLLTWMAISNEMQPSDEMRKMCKLD